MRVCFGRPCKYLPSILLTLAAVFLSVSHATAVELAGIFSKGMVLQRETAVPIWGKGAAGENITAEFGGQKKSTTVGADGKWSVQLDAMPASATPRTLTVHGANALTVDDVLVGEVWLIAGQSNVSWSFAPDQGVRDNEKELAAANYPLVRQFTVVRTNQDPAKIPGAWHKGTREDLLASGNLGDSALGYFFARDLHKELNVPIGIIHASFGGSSIEAWQIGGGNAFLLLQPAAPYAIRGFLWYQGESNLIQGDIPADYTAKMSTLISSYRKLWGNDNLPFYYMQIAPYTYSVYGHSPEALPFFWEAQTKALAIPHTAMVVTTDTVEAANNIHPPNKQDVAQRLVLVALANTYGKKAEYSGPVYKSKEVRGGKIFLSFDHADGLMSKDGMPLTHFTIAGAGQKFVPAEAVIEGDKIIVLSAQIAEPVAVRFAWIETATPNLANKAGLPAVPFRTDDWPMPPNTLKAKS